MLALSPFRICGALLAFVAGLLAYQQLTGEPRFGYPAAQLAQEGVRRLWHNDEAGALADLRAAVAADAANPYRWCDLGEALLQTGATEQAERCMRAAIKRSPSSAQVMARLAGVLYQTGKTSEALAWSARTLARTSSMDPTIFLSFAQFGPGVERVLAEGIGGNQRAAGAYLLDLVSRGRSGNAGVVWGELVRRGWADRETASQYAHAASSRGWHGTAAEAVRFLQSSYGKTDWVFNGGFEAELSSLAYDWRTAPCKGARIGLDRAVRDQGQAALRIEFGELTDSDFHHIAQTLAVEPGEYELSARIRTLALGGDDGLRLHVIAVGASPKLDVWTDGVRGTKEWTTVTRRFQAGPTDRVLKLDLVHRPSRIQQEAGGTAWVDAVRLAHVAE